MPEGPQLCAAAIVYMNSILSSKALSTAPSINPREKQKPLGTAALQLVMEVASVYSDAEDPNPLPLQFALFLDSRMFRGASKWS